MKATTTVTTSSYYGNVDNNKNKHKSQQSQSITQQQLTHFIPPHQMLKRLIPYAHVQKQKQANIQALLKKQQQHQSLSITNNTTNINKQQLVNDIQLLQSQLNNIHAEIIESQNLLNVRDSLYGQLDMLRQQRELIQGDVTYLQVYNQSKQVKINIKPNHGYKEMNERLRRRMNQIREYIHKMEMENRKIEENINYSNVFNIQKNYYRTQQQYNQQMGLNNAWVDNSYYGQRQRQNNMGGRVDELITRLHIKQQQALQNVRRQQQEINRRNTFNRASFMPNSTGAGFQARTYYPQSDSVGGGRPRFYSPQYRY